jgi:N-acetylneuraminate synthase
MSEHSFLQPNIQIGDRQIGPGHSPFIIAELSGNHQGSLEQALALIDAAADAGADAIKINLYRRHHHDAT